MKTAYEVLTEHYDLDDMSAMRLKLVASTSTIVAAGICFYMSAKGKSHRYIWQLSGANLVKFEENTPLFQTLLDDLSELEKQVPIDTTSILYIYSDDGKELSFSCFTTD